MSAQITYKGFDNEDQAARVRELMEECRALFPEETRNIYVNLFEQIAPNDNSSTLMVEIGSLEYLYFNLNVYYAFFDTPREKQRVKIIHELIHALHGKVLMFDRDSLIDYVRAQNPDLGAYLFREHRERVERFTQVFAFAIDEAMDWAERKGHDRAIRDRGAIFVAREDKIEPNPLTEIYMASGMGMEPFPGKSRDREDAAKFSGAIAIGKREPAIARSGLNTIETEHEN